MSEEYFYIDRCDSATGWTAKNTDTINVALSTSKVFGAGSISFDKVDSAANDTAAMVETTYEAGTVSAIQNWLPHDKIGFGLYLSDLTAVVSAFVRIGTDSSNYLTYTVLKAAMTAGQYGIHLASLGNATVTGTGVGLRDITYIALGVNFSLETDALANIRFDGVYLDESEITA